MLIHRFSYGSFRAQLLTILAFFVMGRLSEALLVFNSLRADAVGAEGTLADTAAFLRFILPDGLYNNVRIGGLAYVSIVGMQVNPKQDAKLSEANLGVDQYSW